jgi:Phage related protein
MKTTVEFLDECKRALDLDRDTDLARAIGLSKAQISLLRSGAHSFSDESARRVGEILEIDSAYVMLCAHAERSNDPQIKGVWVRVAQAFATLALSAGVSVGVAPTTAEAALHNVHAIHYTNYGIACRVREPTFFGYNKTVGKKDRTRLN